MNFLKNTLTDVVLRLIAATGGIPLKMKARYNFMFFTDWHSLSDDPTSLDYFIHSRRVYLREPRWHVNIDWSMKQ